MKWDRKAPKVIAGSSELLWKLDSPVTLQPGETRKLAASYKDDSNNRIGGKDVVLTNVTFSQGGASIAFKSGGNRATLEITNSSQTAAAVLATCEVRGKKITNFGRMAATSADNQSIAFYGKRTLNMNLPSIDKLEFAQDIADFEKGRRSQPNGKVKTMTLMSDALQGGGQHAQQLTRTIGDLIRVKEAQTAHDDTYFIMGEEHKLSKRGEVLETTWYLEPATDANWFLLDVSTLDNGVLAY